MPWPQWFVKRPKDTRPKEVRRKENIQVAFIVLGILLITVAITAACFGALYYLPKLLVLIFKAP